MDVIEDLQNKAQEHAILFIERYMPGDQACSLVGSGGGGVGAGFHWVGRHLEERP